jgi:hypothetical protein
MHHNSFPSFSAEVQETIRHKIQECGERDYANSPPCPHGLACGQDLKCDCDSIKKDPKYGIQDYVCMARLPCPVRAIAGQTFHRDG